MQDRRTRPLTVVALALVLLDGGILLGALQLAKAGAIVPDALWILAVLVLAASVYVASLSARSS